jgi:hypothetical protein
VAYFHGTADGPGSAAFQSAANASVPTNEAWIVIPVDDAGQPVIDGQVVTAQQVAAIIGQLRDDHPPLRKEFVRLAIDNAAGTDATRAQSLAHQVAHHLGGPVIAADSRVWSAPAGQNAVKVGTLVASREDLQHPGQPQVPLTGGWFIFEPTRTAAGPIAMSVLPFGPGGEDEIELLADRVDRVRGWHTKLDGPIRGALSEVSGRSGGPLAWNMFTRALDDAAAAVRTAQDDPTAAENARGAYRGLTLAYGLALDQLWSQSIGLDILPTTAELTGRAPTVVALDAGPAGTWLTLQLRKVLSRLSRVDSAAVARVVGAWNKRVAERPADLTESVLDDFLTFVNQARGHGAAFLGPPAADPLVPPAPAPDLAPDRLAAATQAWLAVPIGPQSRAAFDSHRDTIVADLELLSASPVHGAIARLAQNDQLDFAYDYLAQRDPIARRTMMINALSTFGVEALRAMVDLARVAATRMSDHAVIAIVDMVVQAIAGTRPAAEPIVDLRQFLAPLLEVKRALLEQLTHLMTQASAEQLARLQEIAELIDTLCR